MCEQPIAQDIARRIETRQREQYEAAGEGKGGGRGGHAAENRCRACRDRADRSGGVPGEAGRNPGPACTGTAGPHRGCRADRRAEGGQEAAIDKRVAEIQEGIQRQKEDLQREKDAAILAEKAKVLKLTTDLQDMQRKLEGKTANELGKAPRSICSRSCAMRSRATASSAFPRASTAPT